MKTKAFVIALAAFGTAFTGCNDDDNFKVNGTIENAFRTQYPHATRVEWEGKGGYYVADFRLDNADAEAWYDQGGKWYLTETDVHFADLPQAVKDGLAASDYATWRVDDVDKLERPDTETVYVIEVEQANTEYDLYFSPDGLLVKAIPDGNDSPHQPSVVPEAVKTYIAANYPGAKIIDIDLERTVIEVDIVDGRTPREVTFTLTGEWVHTKTEVRKADVADVVLNALTASEYGTWKIDDIDLYDTPAVDYYLFELESGSREVDLKISVDGNIIP